MVVVAGPSHDVRGTFIRNHFATWQGLALLCAGTFLQRMARPAVMPTRCPGS
jgi:hypothetical protein